MNNDTLPTGRILSVQVGKPQSLQTPAGKIWKSAIVKKAITGPVAVAGENLAGDDQANRRYHGGPDKVVCAYSSEWFPLWNQEYALSMPAGAFGENLTLQGLTEDNLCIGDTLLIGSGALLQISQPRQPCANVAKRWAIPSLPRRMEETGHTGFYCRILREGTLESGETVQVAERPYPQWTLRRANTVMYAMNKDIEAMNALRALPLLSPEWKRILGRKLASAQG